MFMPVATSSLPARSNVNVVTAKGGTGPASQTTFTFDLAGKDEVATGVNMWNFHNLVDENTPVDSGIEVASLVAIDPDKGASSSVISLLDGADKVSFKLETVGGVLKLFYVGAALDYETKPRYDVVLRTTNLDTTFADQAFSLLVKDVNDAPSVVITSQVAIVENTVIPADVPNGPKGGIKVGTFTVEDDKLGSADVDLGPGADSSSFAIRHADGAAPNAYELWFVGASPNFDDNKDGFHVDIVVDDPSLGAARSNEVVKTFDLAITDVNEAPAVTLTGVTAPAEYALAGTVVGTLSASDPDGSAGLCSASSTMPAAASRSRAATLVVQDGFRLDAEQAASHQVIVRVFDGVTFFDKAFTIAVGDLNPESRRGRRRTTCSSAGPAPISLRRRRGQRPPRRRGRQGYPQGGVGNDEVRGGLGRDSCSAATATTPCSARPISIR